MSRIHEDDIIRRKLLIDGDGGDADKGLVRLQKFIIEWCSEETEPSDEINRETEIRHQKAMNMCSLAEGQAEKINLIQKTAEREQKRYDLLYQSIGEQLESAKVEIEECKEELVKAKQIRKNKQEYDAWAKKVMEHPDRETTERELELEHSTLKELSEMERELEHKLEYRKKQFAVLLNAIHDLKQELEDEPVGSLEAMDEG